MAYTLVVAEKPSVARDIARVLGAREAAGGYYAGNAYRVTWAIGHLVSLAEPEEINGRWKRWRREDLPMLPDVIPLKVLPKTKKQYAILAGLMLDADCDRIVCATDAGREGELIFRYVYRKAGADKPFWRLWISSMTDEAIREGFASLRPGSAYDTLYQSARCRSEADWLVGMNASRAFTLRYDALLSVGRVQTPTLALLVRRHREIEAFTAKPYWTVRAQFGDYSGLWIDDETGEKRVYDEARAKDIAARVTGGEGVVERVSREEKREWPPGLYDLTSLQRDANRLLGFTAQKTLSVAQTLYEEHKLLTYPRTDSRFLPKDMVQRTRNAIQALPEVFAHHAQPLLQTPQLPVTKRVFDDAKVSDHHAIIPTGKRANLAGLPPDAAALFDLVARRLLAAFYPEHIYELMRVRTCVASEPFESIGRTTLQEGWKAVYADGPAEKKKKKKADDEAQTLPALTQGDRRTVRKVETKAEKTKPPAPHTDASLLSAMEHAGRELEDETLRESMKGSGLGTPATRAAIIERLLQVGYAQRKGRSIQATAKGVKLIAAVPEDIASPETTGRWEKALTDIVSGGMDPERFLAGIRRLAASLVKSAGEAPADIVFDDDEKRGRGEKKRTVSGIGATCPLCGKGKVIENSRSFYCEHWREGCRFTLWKDAVAGAGGPVLTPALTVRVLAQGRVQGSTGVLIYQNGVLRFERKPQTAANE